MFELTANLEADMGIDSIKRIEIISSFRRAVIPAQVEPSATFMEQVSSAKSLEEILNLVAAQVENDTAPVAQPSTLAGAGMAPRMLPYVETILTHRPGSFLSAECELDVVRHPFLLDHTFFGRDLSVNDPTLTTLPVMPLAMTLELMAEAAVALEPGLSVVAMHNVRTHRWVPFETPTRRVRLEATSSGSGLVRVVAYEAGRASGGRHCGKPVPPAPAGDLRVDADQRPGLSGYRLD
jgi:hypothetical protein